MKKRGAAFVLLTLVLSFSLAACGPREALGENGAYTTHTDEEMGLTLQFPQKEQTDGTIHYGSRAGSGEYAPEKESHLRFVSGGADVTLFRILAYAESDWDSWSKEGHTVSEITGVPNSEEIGRESGMVYVYARPEPDETGMDADTKAEYQRILNMVPAVRGSIALIPQREESGAAFPSFSTTDLNGNVVDNASFANYKLTMVNIWGTFCGPCISEMPDLAQLSENMPEGTRLVGIVIDAADDARQTLAKRILSEAGASFENWVPGDALMEYINENITGVPTTLFVDENGRIVGDAILGSRSGEAYLNALNTYLKG
ncbi:MAG: TlpA family protein disulfide reductase [Oscillospiraceae bacterium]|jgi:thiol-disulfide isomerase/thioredoxin